MKEEEKFKNYLKVLNEENTIYKKEEAIQGLLDLYNKQKEEIEELKNKLENVAKIRKCFIEIYNDKDNEDEDEI
jgi:hypothetical protein